MGIFSYTPLREGKGVNPDDPKLRGLFQFFYVYGVNFFKILKLNLLYILFCLPVVTIGPATAAMVYVLKCHINEEHVFLLYDFFRTFKENFLKSLGFSLIQAVALFSLWLSYINLGSIPGMNNLLFPLFLANLLIIITGFYFYPLTVTYDLKFGAIIKNALIFTIIRFPLNLIAAAVFLGIPFAVAWYIPKLLIVLTIVIIPSLIWYFATFFTNGYISRFLTPDEETQGNDTDF